MKIRNGYFRTDDFDTFYSEFIMKPEYCFCSIRMLESHIGRTTAVKSQLPGILMATSRRSPATCFRTGLKPDVKLMSVLNGFSFPQSNRPH